MKKIVRVVLLACVLAVGMTVGSMGLETVWAEEEEIDGLEYWDDDEGIIIRWYDGDSSVLDLAGLNVDGKTVTIEDNAFCDCSNLTEIILPDGVISIGDSAFEDCSSLTEIKCSGLSLIHI